MAANGGGPRGALKKLSVAELEALSAVIAEERLKAAKNDVRNVSTGRVGTAHDSVVQRLAAQQLEMLVSKGYNFSEIAREMGVTGERVRSLYYRLVKQFGPETPTKTPRPKHRAGRR